MDFLPASGIIMSLLKGLWGSQMNQLVWKYLGKRRVKHAMWVMIIITNIIGLLSPHASTVFLVLFTEDKVVISNLLGSDCLPPHFSNKLNNYIPNYWTFEGFLKHFIQIDNHKSHWDHLCLKFLRHFLSRKAQLDQ